MQQVLSPNQLFFWHWKSWEIPWWAWWCGMFLMMILLETCCVTDRQHVFSNAQQLAPNWNHKFKSQLDVRSWPYWKTCLVKHLENNLSVFNKCQTSWEHHLHQQQNSGRKEYASWPKFFKTWTYRSLDIEILVVWWDVTIYSIWATLHLEVQCIICWLYQRGRRWSIHKVLECKHTGSSAKCVSSRVADTRPWSCVTHSVI